jgi:hypothetical protein
MPFWKATSMPAISEYTDSVSYALTPALPRLVAARGREAGLLQQMRLQFLLTRHGRVH